MSSWRIRLSLGIQRLQVNRLLESVLKSGDVPSKRFLKLEVGCDARTRIKPVFGLFLALPINSHEFVVVVIFEVALVDLINEEWDVKVEAEVFKARVVEVILLKNVDYIFSVDLDSEHKLRGLLQKLLVDIFEES